MKIDSISFSYGDHVLFEKASMELSKGSFVFIAGASGSGKSTILRMLMGDIRPDSGEVCDDAGRKISSLRGKALQKHRRRCGFVYQDYQLISYKNVVQNIAFSMEVSGFSHSKIEEKVQTLLARVHLEGKEKCMPHELSGGEQQRVAIARALVHDPDFLLADEPTGNLDSKTRGVILSLFEELNSTGTTIIFATHDEVILSATTRDVYEIEDCHITKR